MKTLIIDNVRWIRFGNLVVPFAKEADDAAEIQCLPGKMTKLTIEFKDDEDHDQG